MLYNAGLVANAPVLDTFCALWNTY